MRRDDNYVEEYLPDGTIKYYTWCYTCGKRCDDIVYPKMIKDTNSHMFFCSDDCRRLCVAVNNITCNK